MNKSAAVLALLLPWLAHAEPAAPSPAAGTPSGRPTYDSFRLIHTRNVFDPDRRPVRPVNSAPAAVGPTRADYAALTGTMLSAEKSYAFFSGSRPEFNKVLSVHDNFANATITGITGQSIEIERGGKRTAILIGQTVPFDNQTAPGEPPAEAPTPEVSSSVSAPGSGGTYRSATGATSPYRPATAGNPAAASTSKAPPANLDEIRRRMMEKRQQELK